MKERNLMWSSITTTGIAASDEDGDEEDGRRSSSPSRSSIGPAARCKHAMSTSPTGHLYLMGGRSGNLALSDLWRFHPGQNQWEELRYKGIGPPKLQEHTMIHWNDKLYVFGGEVGFSSSAETPLWVFDLSNSSWKKQISSPRALLRPGSSGLEPSGRRGHTAVLHGDAIHIYGGYQDLRGSSSELWTFDLRCEQWHLMSCTGRSPDQPSPRHSHSAVIHGNSMWIYGGMTDLQEKGDFWRWDFATREWSRVKTKSKASSSPGPLHSHTAIKAFGSMFIFGGERGINLLHELWRFNFATESWHKISTDGMQPNPRSRHTAVANPFLDPNSLDFQESSFGSHILHHSHSKATQAYLMDSSRPSSKLWAPPKSISMCFGASVTDSPFHEAPKSMKSFKFRVHPMSLNLCSRGLHTSSDDEDSVDDRTTISSQTEAQVSVLAASNQIQMRRTLKDKISQSRLVRSLSSSSYNVLHNQMNSFGDDLLEKLIEEGTPILGQAPVVPLPLPPPPSRGRKGVSQMPKSISSNAVLESDSESSTPIRVRPKSEVIKTLEETELSLIDLMKEDEYEEDWEHLKLKRHTVHESMSYYSLCFPSPPLGTTPTLPPSTSTTPSDSGGVCGPTTEANIINQSSSNPATMDPSGVILRAHISDRPCHYRLSSYEARLQDFEEEDEDEDVEGGNKENGGSTGDKDGNSPSSSNIKSPDDESGITSPNEEPKTMKTSGYNSSATLYTPSVEEYKRPGMGIPHSMSQSSGYHSFSDETFYDQKDIATAFQFRNNLGGGRRNGRRRSKEFNGIEMKQLTDHLHNSNDNGGVMLRKGRARSWDREAVRSGGKVGEEPIKEVNRSINAIKEVIVPPSPETRKWSASPMKGKYQNHWKLCMLVFGGREESVCTAYKQPISVWKLYI